MALTIVLSDHLWATQVGVDLGSKGYMKSIIDATADIDVQAVFCNAGYMLTGFYVQT